MANVCNIQNKMYYISYIFYSFFLINEPNYDNILVLIPTSWLLFLKLFKLNPEHQANLSLHLAVCSSDLNKVKTLLENGWDIDSKYGGYPHLFLAVDTGILAFVKLLLRKGVETKGYGFGCLKVIVTLFIGFGVLIIDYICNFLI